MAACLVRSLGILQASSTHSNTATPRSCVHCCCPPPPQVTSFAELLESRLRLGEALREAVADPAAALRFLQPGRLLRVDGCPPQPQRPLPSLGRYTPPQQPADGDADADAVDGDAAAAAAGCSGAGPEVLSRVDSSVWAVLVNFEKAGKHKQQQQQQQGKLSASSAGDASDDDPGPGARGAAAAAGPRFVIDVLVNVDAKTLPGGAGGSGSHSSSSRGQLPTLLPPGAPGSVAVVLSLPLEHLACLSAVRLKALKDLRSAGARQAGLAAAAEVLARYAAAAGSKGSSSSGQPPLLDPQQDMQVRHTGSLWHCLRLSSPSISRLLPGCCVCACIGRAGSLCCVPPRLWCQSAHSRHLPRLT